MTIRTNPELAALLTAETTQYNQIRVLGSALGTSKRIKCKRVADAATPQSDVWANGTLFRDAALSGSFLYSGVTITNYGSTSNMTTSTAVDLATGKSVMRIEGGIHWVEGTIGLVGSGADFTLAVNPTASNSLAIGPSMGLLPNAALPDGIAIPIDAVITPITVQNTAAAVLTNTPITFGHAFNKGDLPVSGAAVSLRAPDNSLIQCQMDIKATNSDGSVRHAVISAIVPSLAASASVVYSIIRVATAPTGTAPVPANFAGLNAIATVTDTGTDIGGSNAGTVYTADAAPLLSAGTYQTWLSGPIASEWILRVPLKTSADVEHPDLHARFSIRAYAGQTRAKIDYVIENSWAKPKTVPSGTSPWEDVSNTVRIYGYSLKAGTTTVETRAKAGYIRTVLNTTQGVYGGVSTGLANNTTAYTATFVVDGVTKPISIVGSSAQNYDQLKAAFNTQLGGAATCVDDEGMLGFRFVSATTGAASVVKITDYGTLFPALKANAPIYRPIRGDEYIHYPRTRIKKTYWWGTEPTVHIAHDRAYMTRSQAVPNYKADLIGSTTKIASNLSAIDSNGDIGQNGITKALMGDVGYAPGIGILPEWAAMCVINQSKDAKYVMLKQADLGGSWGFHVRDFATDRPISIAQWPYATFAPSAGDSFNAATGLNEKLPAEIIPAHIPANKNQPDSAHHPDFYFLPYMVTGDHFYMEGMLFYQQFLGVGLNPHSTYRDGAKVLWWRNQVRSGAWSLRTAVHAHYLIPDGHQLRAEIGNVLNNNRQWYMDTHATPGGIYYNQLGIVATPVDGIIYPPNQRGIGVFQDDFFTASAGRAVELGYTEWLPWFQFKAKFPISRMTSGTAMCWQFGGSVLSMAVRDSTSSPVYTTIGQVYTASASTEILNAACGSQAMTTAMTPLEGSRQTLNSMAGYPDIIHGYPSTMQPALAYAAKFNIAGAADAVTVFESRSIKPDYNTGPQFAIVP